MTETFFLRLLPPRPDFAQSMTPEELGLMQQHVAYARGFFEAGKLLLYGPVLDPAGSFGIAVLQVESLDEVEAFIAGDPTVQAGLNRYTYAPMRVGGAQAPRT